jgi:sugar lactone lactonase YvrE
MSGQIPTSWRFEKLSTQRAELGESPFWSAAGDCVWWVDITGRQLLRTDAVSGQTRSWATPEEIGFVVLAEDGSVIAGMESGLFLFEPATGAFELICRLSEPGVRFNDAAVDSAGCLWAATMDIDNLKPLGVLYRIDPDLSVQIVETGLRTANGLAVDGERGRVYYSDSHTAVQTIWMAGIDMAAGVVGEKRIFAEMHELAGRPDGAAIDAEGNYWIAAVGGATLYAFSPDGEKISEVVTPMENPTKIAFGGSDRCSVFLSSKMDGEGGMGGFLFQASPGVKGRPVASFGRRF